MLQYEGFTILADYANGKEFITSLPAEDPDVVLMDYEMPVMDGVSSTQWITKHKPDWKVLALSMKVDDMAVIRMLRAGAKGYIPKGVEPEELTKAIMTIHESGVYYSDLVSGKMKSMLFGNVKENTTIHDFATEREIEFLKLSCTEATYKEISEIMGVSVRTVDGYREALFEKFHLKSRQGLALFAIKNKLVQID